MQCQIESCECSTTKILIPKLGWLFATKSGHGLVVMTLASQAYNPGSNPGDRMFHVLSKLVWTAALSRVGTLLLC